jgi:hypothetical protein
MKNGIYLLVALLISASAYAKVGFQEAQQKIASSQARVNQLKSQIQQKDRRVQGLQSRLDKVAGNPDYADDINNYNDAIIRTINEREGFLKQYDAALRELNKNIGLVGRKHHITASEEEGYQVVAPSEAQQGESVKYTRSTRSTRY